MHRAALLLLLIASCSPKPLRPPEAAALDVEIERAILWEFRGDARFASIRIACHDRVAVLRGSVATRPIAEEALRRARKAAQDHDGDAEVRSELEIRQH